MDLSFSQQELKDLAIAWVALSIAFTIFYPGIYFRGAFFSLTRRGGVENAPQLLAIGFGISFVTVGVGFLLHELAHKVTAVHYGQLAEFRADYGFLFLAVMAGFAGFLFAAPGAVYHRGFVTKREQGLIALAGPVTNLGIAAAFAPLWLFGPGLLAVVGGLGVIINLLLAGFNMIPFGPLDGKKVLNWDKKVFVASAVPLIGLAVWAVFGLGL